MPVEHLPNTASPDAIAAVIERDGCAVVDRLASPDQLAKFASEVAPYESANATGIDDFAGRRTKRTGALIARSPTARDFVTHPSVLGAVAKVLAHATGFQLHLTQLISIGPGEPMQQIHRDQWAFDFFPFPSGFEVQCNTIWAISDFSAENGATRVIPGSHRFADKLKFSEEQTEPAEMAAGSVLFYTGALYHGGGANRSARIRSGLNLTYNLAWLRQEENQYLACPLEIARTLPDPLLRLMGYARGAYALGYVGDVRDPIESVKPHAGVTQLGDLSAALGRLEESRA
ncbi:MAG TPA: phytanoyl-CoA dioxygenase family protein [Myxococcota bacterium]|jgi:ectoine hydroxylase-related dioxygenase (phytanoyl-CoA dioxygenase family)